MWSCVCVCGCVCVVVCVGWGGAKRSINIVRGKTFSLVIAPSVLTAENARKWTGRQRTFSRSMGTCLTSPLPTQTSMMYVPCRPPRLDSRTRKVPRDWVVNLAIESARASLPANQGFFCHRLPCSSSSTSICCPSACRFLYCNDNTSAKIIISKCGVVERRDTHAHYPSPPRQDWRNATKIADLVHKLTADVWPMLRYCPPMLPALSAAGTVAETWSTTTVSVATFM